MNGLWKKRIPAFLLTLVMLVSLMPAALAVDPENPDGTYAGIGCTEANHTINGPGSTMKIESEVPATCGKPGDQVWVCSVCKQWTQTIHPEATGNHDYTNVPWTKVNDQQHSRKCNVCDQKETVDHSWNFASPSEDGKKHTKYCPDCQYTLTEGHTHSSSETGTRLRGAPCDIYGGTTYPCSVCGVNYTVENERPGHIDNDGDGACDRCKKPLVTGITITFNTNGGGTIPTQTVASGGTLPNAVSDPSKSGCAFMGWQQDTPGSLYTGQTTLLTSGRLNALTFTASASFYAIWQVKAENVNGAVSAASDAGSVLWSHISDKCGAYFGGAGPYSVTFGPSLPGSSDGTLYLSGAARVQAGTPYTESDFRYMTFTPGTSDTVYRLYYTAKDSSGQNSVSGYVDVSGQPAAAAAASSYTGDIRYATTGANVQINANDIARYFQTVYPGQTLLYVSLAGIPSAGGLYYNYYGASGYGAAGRTQITSADLNVQNYYLSPSSAAQYALTELTYVPSGSNYCAVIPFTACGTGGASTTGSILISVTRGKVAEVYGVIPRNTEVAFPASAIYSAVLSATNSALGGIQLLELPPAAAGTVYLDSAQADTRTAYTYAAGAGQMSALRFVPASGFTGSVEIPYAALDANGNAMACGTFALGVLSSRRTLTDVGASTWCYKYVMELTDQNVVSGYSDGSFKPNTTVTYGAALKLIMLAAGYPEQAPTGEHVFSGYLTRAQADGIITRSDVSLTAPITRLQVAQLAAGALRLDTSGLSSVKPFTDTDDVYVQALNAAGIVEGYFSNGTSTYRPGGTLTRGQMSAIVWRMNQYRK